VSLVAGMHEGTSPTSWPLVFQKQYVTLQGQGYLSLGWQSEYASKAGLITLPIITLVSGSFLHVGSSFNASGWTPAGRVPAKLATQRHEGARYSIASAYGLSPCSVK
jgi:hypothetical protein